LGWVKSGYKGPGSIRPGRVGSSRVKSDCVRSAQVRSSKMSEVLKRIVVLLVLVPPFRNSLVALIVTKSGNGDTNSGNVPRKWIQNDYRWIMGETGDEHTRTAWGVQRGRRQPQAACTCGWATPETVVRLFQGWPACRAQVKL
jgi:hypothetical protein